MTCTSDSPPPEESDAARQLRRSTELLWGPRDRPARGPKPGLTLDRIVDAAVEVADAEGVEGLSMRRVAAELGVGTMSLYRYVPGKAELLNLMLDRISPPSEAVAKAREQGWRAAVEVSARESRELYLAHPWLLRVNWTRPVFGPNTLANFEQFMGVFAGLGLTSQEMISMALLVDGYVTGAVRQQLLYASAPEETGLSDEEFWTIQLPVLERAMETGNYPVMAAMDENAFEAGWEESFEFGLQRVLDGIEALVRQRGETCGRDQIAGRS